MKKTKKIILILFIMSFLGFTLGCNDKIDDETDSNIQYYHTEVLSLDQENNYIELLDCPVTKLNEALVVNKLIDNKLEESSLDEIFIGANNIYVQVIDNEIKRIIIDGDSVFNYIRVAIRNSISDIANISTLTHQVITIEIPNNTIIKTYDNDIRIDVVASTTAVFKVDENYIYLKCAGKEYYFNKRVIIEETKDEMTVSSISRGVGTPKYNGSFDISLYNNKLLLINEVNMEDYLTKVVPSEMPTSWELEALKAQAVAARTYAYREIYNRKYVELGYIVDDSTMSQVYNNGSTALKPTQAVNETKGITMFCENQPIIAYYYSASSGLTGSGNEVWITDNKIDEIPYLIGKNLTNVKVDTNDEISTLAFFKKIYMISPSGNSTNHRWKVEMNKEQLKNTLNYNLRNMYNQYKESYKIYKNNEWQIIDEDSDILNDIGEILSIKVSERGTSGVVISLEIETDKCKIKIYNQYNIRFTIRPRTEDCGSAVNVFYAKSTSNDYTSTKTDVSILPSGYFALEIEENNIIFYGGGSGHGIGMSQYGAQYLASNNIDYESILKTYYTNINFIDTSSIYTPLEEYKEYFK